MLKNYKPMTAESLKPAQTGVWPGSSTIAGQKDEKVHVQQDIIAPTFIFFCDVSDTSRRVKKGPMRGGKRVKEKSWFKQGLLFFCLNKPLTAFFQRVTSSTDIDKAFPKKIKYSTSGQPNMVGASG